MEIRIEVWFDAEVGEIRDLAARVPALAGLLGLTRAVPEDTATQDGKESTAETSSPEPAEAPASRAKIRRELQTTWTTPTPCSPSSPAAASRPS